MVVAFLSAACWSFTTPPFQVPDEPDHFAYVQQLAETGRLPSSGERLFSPEELTALRDLDWQEMRLQPQNQALDTAAQQSRLEHDLHSSLSRRSELEAAGNAASEPPLYYAMETIPYALGSAGTLLDQLELMRLLSATMAAFTALFAFLFVREALPGESWAWTVGGLGVALSPLLGFMAAGVNPDALLYADTAALFYLLARGFRRGLTSRTAHAIGAVIAIGLLSKLNFAGIAPGAALGLLLLARRASKTHGRAAYRWLAAGLAIGLTPALAFAFVNALSHHHTLGIVSSAGAQAGKHGSILGEISYLWQFYLPRLPGMSADFPHYLTTSSIWFDGYVGLYGWFDTTFPAWVYDVALIPAVLILGACVRSLIAGRAALRDRLGELLVYGAIALGLMVLVGADSYLRFPAVPLDEGHTRYLLPLLPLLGGVFALASRAGGRRWGPAIGMSLIMLLFAHDLFSQLQTIARYYG
jgi:4-amino-4-deoxy-L-arabinose transferase-like glycosyltransferase